ncbi:MAG: helicase [Candidatus Sulfotelmatobacter sp.]|nr:helicase [Candidatus Sulfotelmatobacter sp.]
MAKMIPPHWHEKTPSSEQRIFNMLQNDPATVDWVVLHSLNLKQSGTRPYGEIDFVVLIPAAGVICLEVKGGRVACANGTWTSTDSFGKTHTLKRSPFKQAQEGMHELRAGLEERLKRTPIFYQVPFGYAVVFTDVEAPPADIGTEPWEVIDCHGLTAGIAGLLVKAVKQQRNRLKIRSSPPEPQPAILKQMRDTLRPDFERIVTRGTLVSDSERKLLSLTEEQYEVLDLLAGNPRCLFEGAAGTGKTLLALEFSRRLARAGDRVLLICFNRLLGEWFSAEITAAGATTNVICGRFYKCLRDTIATSAIASEFFEAEKSAEGAHLFNSVYPLYGQFAIEQCTQKFDVIVMDEAQDLMKPAVLQMLDAWLKGGLAKGRWAFFGDFHRQAIYGTGSSVNPNEALASSCTSYARAALRQNCRNTRRIGEETALLSGFESPPYRMGQIDGAPVEYLNYDDLDSQRSALERVLSQMASETDIKPADVVVLSRYRLEQSAAAGVTNTTEFCIRPADAPASPTTRKPTFLFATAQAFKGMESKIVVLCDVDRIESEEDRSLLYVAMSRARSLLTVLLHTHTKTAVREAFSRKMSEQWR